MPNSAITQTREAPAHLSEPSNQYAALIQGARNE